MAPAKKKSKRSPATLKKGNGVRMKKSWILDMSRLKYSNTCHRPPLALLYLTRISKGFRALLLSRSKTCRIWQEVLASVEGRLPSTPQYLSEPAISNGKKLEDLFSGPLSQLAKEHGEKLLPQAKLRLCSENSFQRHYYLPDIAHLQEQFNVLPQKDGEIFNYFLHQRLQLTSNIYEHAQQCLNWVQRVEDAREKERVKLVSNRKADIISRLTKAGWGDELKHVVILMASRFSLLPEVNKTEELDDGKYDARVAYEYLEGDFKSILPGLVEKWYEDVLKKFEDHIRSEIEVDNDYPTVLSHKCLYGHVDTTPKELDDCGNGLRCI
ncbi:hypothetical protein SERLA73DRAFT_157904 [Serpula lacrymans var. lacrymans S7.3]|uniref:F-box domain-containing protein n=1 Tax=Serpula lacrymans var. lacrymans (strain S7.3) TaxID=936435 RepID=F8PG09_SERL3|nr:hypothetical protein SERLA73DRAFT_157904 [Serpula lacrymans var. lacrymans S7.3]